VLTDITGVSARLMVDALIDGERRAQVLAGLAKGTLRSAGKQADLSMALTARFTEHHATMCRLHRDQVKLADHAVAKLDEQIASKAGRRPRELVLLRSVPGFGDVVSAAWLAGIGPAPHRWFPGHGKLASWATLCPGNNISARKRKSGRTGDAGTYIKPMLVQAAWGAVQVRGRLQARYRRLVRRFGGDKNPGAKKKKAIIAIAHTLLKIAYQVLKTGQPCTDLGADFCTRRESPEQQHAYLERRLQKLHPGCTVTITISPHRAVPRQAPPRRPPDRPAAHRALTRRLPEPPTRHPGYAPDNPATTPGLPAALATVRCRAPSGTQFSCQRAINPKLRPIRQAILGLTWDFTAADGWRSGYFKVSGIGVPMSSKACRWALVGSASIAMVTSVPVYRTWLRVSVARCSSRPRKLR